MMAPLSDALRSLSKHSSELNAKTDELTAVFVQVEKQLADARVGVSIWLQEDGQLVEESDRRDGRSTAWAIGYAKLGSDWRLAARQMLRRESLNDLSETVVEIEDSGIPPTALVNGVPSASVREVAVGAAVPS